MPSHRLASHNSNNRVQIIYHSFTIKTLATIKVMMMIMMMDDQEEEEYDDYETHKNAITV